MNHDPRQGRRRLLERLKSWACSVKRDVFAVYLASRDPRVPWYAKAIAVLVAAYALSPIDLIPDFIPVLGYLDDLLLLPLGIALVVCMIPPGLMAEHRAAAQRVLDRPVSRAAAVVIILLWLAALAVSAWLAIRWYRSRA
jgi:uncharacterized membrane protein YkvA (DUF1232 family)